MTKEEFKALLQKQKEDFLKTAKEQASELATQLSSEKVSGLEQKFNELKTNLETQMADALKNFDESRKVSLPGVADEMKAKKKTFGWSGAVQALLHKNGEFPPGFELEQEIIEQTAKIAGETKSNNAGTGAGGGFLIPDEITNEIIELAIAQMPLMEMGPQVYRGLVGELPIPKITGRPTAYWIGEEEAPTESAATFGEIILKPYSLGAFTKISRKLLHQSRKLADTLIRKLLAESIALKLEQDLLEATSGEKHPTGLVNISGLTSTTALDTAGARFRVNDAATMIKNIDVANMLKPNSNAGFIMRPEVLYGLKTERVVQYSGQAEGAGMPVINPLINTKVLEDILGAKLRTTTLLSNAISKGGTDTLSRVIFGAWENMKVGFWEGFELKASMEAGNSSGSAFLNRQIWLMAYQDVDMKLGNETGFTVLSDAKTVF